MHRTAEVLAHPPAPVGEEPCCRNTAVSLLSTVSPCLSRACLGKMIVFISKNNWLPKKAFSAPYGRKGWAVSLPALNASCRKRISVLSVFPMFVPSLSW